ncbi:Hypothetical_protein [Hexamita inflata]|uniref:Hypothetical_protein n=1 Tax=Hexamita inflata TaxID=28002 RepID=A0AA86N705_9EUKA|nr:Hypothetical protein HINF_LOCUS1734 [Hexamita inflata]
MQRVDIQATKNNLSNDENKIFEKLPRRKKYTEKDYEQKLALVQIINQLWRQNKQIAPDVREEKIKQWLYDEKQRTKQVTSLKTKDINNLIYYQLQKLKRNELDQAQQSQNAIRNDNSSTLQLNVSDAKQPNPESQQFTRKFDKLEYVEFSDEKIVSVSSEQQSAESFIYSVSEDRFQIYEFKPLTCANTSHDEQYMQRQKELIQQQIKLDQKQKFEACVLEAINAYYFMTEGVKFATINEALLNYRKYVLGLGSGRPSKIHLNLKKIANTCEITEKQCNQQFQTLLANAGEEVDQCVKQQVMNRIHQLVKEMQSSQIEVAQCFKAEMKEECADRDKQIKQIIENEFQFKKKPNINFKQISNYINYHLKKLKD